jgi:hypothetical protein
VAEETHVLFQGKLPGKAVLNRAMKELGFPLAIKPATGSLEGHSGYLPMTLRREETGVEFDIFEGRDAVEELAGKTADPHLTRSANFRWGGDENEMLAGLCAAAALAKLTDGAVVDEAENRLLTVDQAVERARENLKAVSPPQKKPRDKLPGTRPADIKRYLKPLLQERDDLVLVGRFLFIRPVRHLIRGAFLDRTSDKFSFRLYATVKPLYGGPEGIGCGGRIHDGQWEVWQPHFQGLLMASLAEDVFNVVGKVTTFSEFADFLAAQRDPLDWVRSHILALVLAGEQDQAAAYLKQLQRDNEGWTHWLDEIGQDISGNVATLCDRLHAREAETVKTLKLEDVWEASPFPIELPVSQRHRMSEPAFSTMPWVTKPPSPLHRPPQHPGEVRFAKSLIRRDDGVVLVAPLTRDQAQVRHRDSESYLLAARLADGMLIIIARRTFRDRNAPQRFAYSPNPSSVSPHIELHGLSHVATTWLSFQSGGVGLLQVSSISVHKRLGFKSEWHCNIDFQDGEVGIYDSRDGPGTRVGSALTPPQRDAALWPLPAFGEYADANEQIRSLLSVLGFGEIR